MSTVVGIFNSRDQAEEAVSTLREKGFTENEISIVARGDEGGGDDGNGDVTNDLTTGTATGGALGGVAGLLAGIGALAIPGVGPIVAAGPIAAGLSGAVAGGLAGGLVDWGIPESRGRYYEGRVKQGNILAMIKTDKAKVDDAATVLRDTGASDVETH